MPRSYEQIRQSLMSQPDVSNKLDSDPQLFFGQATTSLAMRKDHGNHIMVSQSGSGLNLSELQRPKTTSGLSKPSIRGFNMPKPGKQKGATGNSQYPSDQKSTQDEQHQQLYNTNRDNTSLVQKTSEELSERLKEQSLHLQQKEMQIRGLLEELDAQHAENRRLRKQYDQQFSELQEARNNFKTSQEELKLLKQQLEQSIGRAGGAANETERLRQALKKQEAFIETQKLEISQLKQQLAERGQQAASAAVAHQNTQNELRAANELLRSSNEQRANLQKKLQEQSEATTQETAELRQELSNLQTTAQLVDGFRLELGRQEQANRKMSVELAQLRLMRDRAAEDKERVFQLENELKCTQQTVIQQQAVIKSMQEQSENQNDEIIKLQKKLENANTEFARNISQQISQKAEVARLTDRAINLQDQAKVSLEQCRLLSIERTKLEAENGSLGSENSQNQQRIAKLLTDIDQLNNQLYDMQLENKTQIIEIKGLEQKVADKDGMIQDLLSYELAVDEERGTYLSQIAELQTKNSISETTIEKLNQQIDMLNQKQNNQNAKMVELRFEVAKLQQREQKEQQLDKQLRSKTVEVTKQRQKILELEGQVQNMKVQLQVAMKKYPKIGKLPGIPSSSSSSNVTNVKKVIECNSFGLISKISATKDPEVSSATQESVMIKDFITQPEEEKKTPAENPQNKAYNIIQANNSGEKGTDEEVNENENIKIEENNEAQKQQSEELEQNVLSVNEISVKQDKQPFNIDSIIKQVNALRDAEYEQLIDIYCNSLYTQDKGGICAYQTIQNDFI